MRDNVYENQWDPFSPEWYKQNFDKFISTGDYFVNQNLVIDAGYDIPDADGSKSSVYRNSAILNNSFDETILRESLSDIYLNSSHKLTASNRDNINFFKWYGNMSDLTYIPSTNQCEFRIPWNMFIHPKTRDVFKLSRFYRTWIKIEDILNNWDIFEWHVILFIDKRVYSDYEIYIDEHEVVIRFVYTNYWVKQNTPVYIYKFETNFQQRIKISYELVVNQWKWKVPLSVIPDKRILNHSKVMVTFNRIGNTTHRTDDESRIEILGHNIDFLDIENGYIDISKISGLNNSYILSELKEYMWMTICVPKFFHEYPVLLPTDVVHRPYNPDLRPVVTLRGESTIQKVKSETRNDETKQVYVDMKGKLLEHHDGWIQIIRPIVLSDAFENPLLEPNDLLVDEVRNVRKAATAAADALEEFRTYFTYEVVTDDKMKEYNSNLESKIKALYDVQNAFYDKRRADRDYVFNAIYNDKFTSAIEDIYAVGEDSLYLNPIHHYDDELWKMCSEMITICHKLVDRFYIIEILRGMDKRHLWTDPKSYLGKVRFQRPINELDFWMFEYDVEHQVWWPAILDVKKQFPDVYIVTDPNDQIPPTLNRLFKAFFFYSDTMNILEESRDINRATPMWDEDFIEYHYEPHAIYRDIFMEKFYWMGVQSIYKGLLMTECRWEVIEHVINNESYERFNDLFLKTMDPYFKLGLATYLKSSNFEFPFDDAIAKFQESITTKWNDYKRITNFEIYLNKDWVPSYFDHVVKIMDDWKWGHRLVKRPHPTFDMRRLIPIIQEIEQDITTSTYELLKNIEWVLTQLREYDYNINIPQIEDLQSLIYELLANVQYILKFIKELDLAIYSIDGVNHIIKKIDLHWEYVMRVRELLNLIEEDVRNNCYYETKRAIVNEMHNVLSDSRQDVEDILQIMSSFDMYGFMLAVNDLHTYMNARKINPDDVSVIGTVNKFNDPWSDSVKEPRNALFLSTNFLNSAFDPKKTYTDEEVEYFIGLVEQVKAGIGTFRSAIEGFWEWKESKGSQDLIDKFDHVEYLISEFHIYTDAYYTKRNTLIDKMDSIKELLSQFNDNLLMEPELEFKANIIDNIDIIIEAVSYIVGIKSREDAETSLDNIKNILDNWLEFLLHEEEVFDVLFEIVEQPSLFIVAMERFQELLDAVKEYMNTVNDPFIPDTGWPTYSEVFEVTDVDIFSRGFRYASFEYEFRQDLGINGILAGMEDDEIFSPLKGISEKYDTLLDLHGIEFLIEEEIELFKGDTLYVPNLASYLVIKTSNEICRVEAIKDTGFVKTTFRDPCIQSTPYFTISDGIGAGCSLKAKKSSRVVIKNDTAVVPILTRIENTMRNIRRSLLTPNPYNNSEYFIMIDGINITQNRWDHLKDVFNEYLTNEIKTKMNDLLEALQLVVEPSREFINNRSTIDIQKFAEMFETLMRNVLIYANEIDYSTEEFHYEENLARVTYNKLLTFLGTGTSWNDSDELSLLLNELEAEINRYKNNILPLFPDVDETVSSFTENLEVLNEWIGTIRYGIASFNRHAHEVEIVLEEVQIRFDIISIPDLYQDEWYRIEKVIPAIRGEGYEIGDICEIVPALPLDENEEPIHDNEELIMNDRLFIQILQVHDGKVLEIKPLLDYALPYGTWGIRETITRTGTGTGLTIDIFGHRVSLADSTILNTGDMYESITPRFQENDLFMFKFENLHDLNIQYEAFIAGGQVRNFIQRHEDVNDPLHPRKIDVIYLKANDVINLQNSSIYIPADNYYVYRINAVDISDNGTGYCVGQKIYIQAGPYRLGLKVAELIHEPYKGINFVQLADGKLTYDRHDPFVIGANVVTDSLNNIDDEFNVGYYDHIPREGIQKPALLGPDADKFMFIARRFDDMDGDDRNKIFMYPLIEIIKLVDLYRYTSDNGYVTYPAMTHQGVYGIDDINNMYHPLQGLSDEHDTPLDLFRLVFADGSESSLYELLSGKVGDGLYAPKIYTPLKGAYNKFADILPPVDNGDPDFFWYQGSRIDNSQHIHYEYNTNPTVTYHGLHGIDKEDEIFAPLKGISEKYETAFDLYGLVFITGLEYEFVDSEFIPRETNTSNRWNGIMNLVPPTHPFLDDNLRFPPNNPPNGEYQLIERLSIHRLEHPKEFHVDLEVPTFADLPKHCLDWPEGAINKYVAVTCDERHHGHRMIYRIRTFVVYGYFVYNLPFMADESWDHLDVDWMNIDWYPEKPGVKQMYPTAPWRTSKSYRQIEEEITDKKHDPVADTIIKKQNYTSYIYPIETVVGTTYEYDKDSKVVQYELYGIDDTDEIYTPLKGISEKYSNIFDLYGLVFITGLEEEFIDPEAIIIKSALSLIYGISVFNWTTKQWENLRDPNRWFIEVINDDVSSEWGFRISFVGEGYYSYDMGFYLNKVPFTQMRNATLKRNAVMDIHTIITDEVDIPAINKLVHTGRHLRIRKLFPYEQKETFTIGFDEDRTPIGFDMDFKLAPYMHFRNEIHLEDVKVYNKTAGRFENLMDPQMFEVRFKDQKATNRGTEDQTVIDHYYLGGSGSGFHDGAVWGYNRELGVNIFGIITATVGTMGHVLTFTPTHCPNPPEVDVTLEFELYQTQFQNTCNTAIVIIRFEMRRLEVNGDGYIHNVSNPLAITPNEFKIIPKYNMDGAYEYEIIIDKTPHMWSFIEENWILAPTFHIPGHNIPSSRLYILTDKGRFPLINPSTGMPSLYAKETEDGTDVIFLNLYRRFENLEIHSVPYPMRSVYVQRRVPSHGYINLAGKLNKPLNKKYFEFWMNGRLLHDEVTIISPTKIFLHGLRSLRNFEIIEINRDPNEYFSDIFLENHVNTYNRPSTYWNYETYLDHALEGKLEGDNYSLEEQEQLLSPIWRQVDEKHRSYKDYPPNADLEDDIIQRVYLPEDYPIEGLDDKSYQFLLIDPPVLEEVPITGSGLRWEQFGWLPIKDSTIVDMLNEEWADEIEKDPYLEFHVILSDYEWYGTTARLYDEYGILVHNLNEAVYKIVDPSYMNINAKDRKCKIINQSTYFDLE